MEIDPSEFYFGNTYDLKTQAIIPDKITYYDPQDLTTHMVITGMTGSGKTGMGIILLEEAALKGIPAILIDENQRLLLDRVVLSLFHSQQSHSSFPS